LSKISGGAAWSAVATTLPITIDVQQDGDKIELQSSTMATAFGAYAPLVTSKSSSFGLFRLAQFVDNAPQPPNATVVPSTRWGQPASI